MSFLTDAPVGSLLLFMFSSANGFLSDDVFFGCRVTPEPSWGDDASSVTAEGDEAAGGAV